MHQPLPGMFRIIDPTPRNLRPKKRSKERTQDLEREEHKRERRPVDRSPTSPRLTFVLFVAGEPHS